VHGAHALHLRMRYPQMKGEKEKGARSVAVSRWFVVDPP
jgi:hypothetical protein